MEGNMGLFGGLGELGIRPQDSAPILADSPS